MNLQTFFLLILVPQIKNEEVQKISSLCRQQFEALDRKTLLQMLDASAKTMTGLLYLNTYQLGNFDECYNIAGEVYGKYCLGTIEYTKEKRVNLNQLHIGICIPNGCTVQDLRQIFSFANFSEDWCYSQDSKPVLTPAAITTITILATFIGVVILATICDMVYSGTSKVILAFSALTNARKLIKPSMDNEQLLCLNGIKAISMMWVILGHVYVNASQGPLGDLVDIRKWQENVANMVIVNATVSVDSFFTVGGLITVYTFLKSTDKGVKFNILLYYLHRYLRLTPALAIMVLIHATVVPYLGEGPLWGSVFTGFVKDCQDYWWSALLYIQNYFHGGGTCVPQSWYLSVDFQLFLLSPIILIPLQKHPKIGVSILGFLVVLGCLIPFMVGYVYELPAFLGNLKTKPDEMMWRYYKQTYTRFGPYVIGMIFGYYIYKIKTKQWRFSLDNIGVILIWTLSIGTLVACVYAPYSASLTYGHWSHALVLAFMRNAWAVGLCGVIFICVSGYGGVVDTFLSLPGFQFLTKLSYSMYLVHYIVISIRYASMKEVFLLSNQLMLWSFWGDFTFTLFLSLILCLTFESPVIVLEKYIFGTSNVQSSRKKLTV